MYIFIILKNTIQLSLCIIDCFNRSRKNAFKSSAIDLHDLSKNEALFWQNMVTDWVGFDVSPGIQQEDRTKGLRFLRMKATIAYLSVNFLWVAIWIGTDALLMKFFTDRLLYGLILFCLLCVPICIQILGMTVCDIFSLTLLVLISNSKLNRLVVLLY